MMSTFSSRPFTYFFFRQRVIHWCDLLVARLSTNVLVLILALLSFWASILGLSCNEMNFPCWMFCCKASRRLTFSRPTLFWWMFWTRTFGCFRIFKVCSLDLHQVTLHSLIEHPIDLLAGTVRLRFHGRIPWILGGLSKNKLSPSAFVVCTLWCMASIVHTASVLSLSLSTGFLLVLYDDKNFVKPNDTVFWITAFSMVTVFRNPLVSLSGTLLKTQITV